MKNSVYHKENPFLSDMGESLPEKEYQPGNRIVCRDPENPASFATDENGNIIMVRGRGPVIKGPIDTAKYFKLFTGAIPKLLGLSRAGMEMFLYLAGELQPKCDKVVINAEDAKAYLGYKSAVSVHNGLDSLIDRGVIAKAYSGKRGKLAYWINPDVIFNGNRVVLSKRIDNATNKTTGNE